MGISTEGGGGFQKDGFSTHLASAQRPCESSGSPLNSILTTLGCLALCEGGETDLKHVNGTLEI